MKRKIILIGGMPTAGKTTLSFQVARHYNLPHISTDQIRIIMQSVADMAKYPLLFDSEGYSAEEFLTEYTAEEIADMEYEQGREVWLGVKKFIENDWVWRDGCVIEGVSILPSLVHDIDTDSRDVRAVFVSDNNHERIKHVVYNRGLYDDANLYSDNVKDREVEWVKLFDNKMREDAKKAGYPVINLSKSEDDIHKVLIALDAQ